ncbi:MAG: hypothetical protein II183_03725, partial [Elusimicrobiaceae bacterium]|nr:hypothetical protein [Elusimicrobiaceae bacterium]
VDTFLSTGVLPNISEENIRKLADFWGITNKDMKKFLNGKDTEIILKKIQKNMENKLQQAMKESGISIDPKNMDPTLQN